MAFLIRFPPSLQARFLPFRPDFVSTINPESRFSNGSGGERSGAADPARHTSPALRGLGGKAQEEPVLAEARKATLLAGGQSTPLGSRAPGSTPLNLLFLDVIYSPCPAESWEDEQWLLVVYC